MIHVWLVKQQGALRIWDANGNNWATVSSWQGLNDSVYAPPNDKDICLYVPTQAMLSLSNELNNAQIKQLGESGLQYLFEDLALTPVEQLRVRHWGQGAKRTFYALGTSDIQQWEHSAQLAGYKITAMLPDFMLLPFLAVHTDKEGRRSSDSSNSSVLDKQVALYQDTQTVLVRQSEYQGMAISYLSLLPRLLPNIDEIVYLSGEDDGKDLDNKSVGSKHADRSTSQPVESFAHGLKQICDAHDIVLTVTNQALSPVVNANKHTLNFIEIKRTRFASPYLTLAASILLLAGVTQIAMDSLQWYQYKQATAAVTAANEAQFSSWFAGETLNPRVNVMSQVQPRLIQDKSSAQTQLSTLNTVSPVIKQSNLVAKTLRWNDSSIDIVVTGKNRNDIDNLQRTLNEHGVSASLGAVNPTADGGVMGELTIPILGASGASSTVDTNTVS